MAEMDVVLAVARQVDELRKKGAPLTDLDLGRLAAQIADGFKARKDEVAILRLSADARMLSFLFPLKLSVVGEIPITTMHSLAAKTIRDKRGEFVNNFSTYRHASVFESVNLSEQEKAVPIQKIMSSPMILEGKVMGVIQVSRKGHPGVPVGPDFTHADLAQLASVGTILGKILAELPPPSGIHLKAPDKPH